MDLLWTPLVHSPARVDIPEIVVGYDPPALEGWMKANKPRLKSNRKNYKCWGKYAPLASSGRFLLPYANEKKARRFAELHAALLLEREGFHCWGGAHLFDYGVPVVRGKGNSKRNTDEIRSKAPWRWPGEIRKKEET